MRRYEARTVADALEAAGGVKHDAMDRWLRSFARKAGRHLETNYRDTRGLRMVGMGGLDTSSLIVFWVDDDDSVEVSYMVEVHTPDGKECFDSEEALGYSEYIKAAKHVAERKASLIRNHLEEKRSEQCDESAT